MSREPENQAGESGTADTPDARRRRLLEQAVGEPITLANEFAEIRVVCVRTRNGLRLLVDSPKSGQWVTLDPLELEALTWQNQATLSAMVG
ncbi:hypothetical protein ACWF94_33115, partial [Streptomyces sp. NPDC055078]